MGNLTLKARRTTHYPIQHQRCQTLQGGWEENLNSPEFPRLSQMAASDGNTDEATLMGIHAPYPTQP